jgi:5S rRNA maturation endonuclease (ribonuclease M5)
MNYCSCCSKEVFDSPNVKYIYDSEGEIIKENIKLYHPEKNIFIDMAVPSKQYDLPKNFALTITDPYFSYIKKNFCEDCYNFIIKDKIEELLKFLINFNQG